MRRVLSFIGVMASAWLAVLGVVLSIQLTAQQVYSLPAVAGASTSSHSALRPLTAAVMQNRTVPLVEDDGLMQLAELRAQDMVERQYYSHETPEGDDFADMLASVGLRSDLPSCENLLLTRNSQPDEMIAEWLASASHRDCMLDADMARVGVAVVDYGDGFQLAVMIFAAAQ